jgi:hypothetical protein
MITFAVINKNHPTPIPSPKKNRQQMFVAGFTIRSLTPVVTMLGCQFIASTHKNIPQHF